MIKVDPFCRKGLRDLSRQATSHALTTGQRDAVERTFALGFALRRKSSPAGWTYADPSLLICIGGTCSLHFSNAEPAVGLLAVRGVGEAKGEAVCKWVDDAESEVFSVLGDLC